MTNMSNMVMNGQSNNNMSTMTMSNMDTNGNDNDSNKEMNSMNTSSSSTVVGMDVGGGEGSESGINSSSLVNLTDYQSAQALAAKALEIFNTELRPIAPNNSSALLTNLENGLTDLNASIRNKASSMDIMMIVHTQIHPNILQAFNLRME
jgi:hypothetical protein